VPLSPSPAIGLPRRGYRPGGNDAGGDPDHNGGPGVQSHDAGRRTPTRSAHWLASSGARGVDSSPTTCGNAEGNFERASDRFPAAGSDRPTHMTKARSEKPDRACDLQ